MDCSNTALGGICFELRDTPSVSSHFNDPHDTPPTSYIMLKVRNLPEKSNYATDNPCSLSLSLCEPCSTSTSSSATVYTSTISRLGSFCAWLLASFYRRSIERVSTAFNTVCCQRSGWVSSKRGIGSRRGLRPSATALPNCQKAYLCNGSVVPEVMPVPVSACRNPMV